MEKYYGKQYITDLSYSEENTARNANAVDPVPANRPCAGQSTLCWPPCALLVAPLPGLPPPLLALPPPSSLYPTSVSLPSYCGSADYSITSLSTLVYSDRPGVRLLCFLTFLMYPPTFLD
ncbi:unnamed protein product [Heligmosomoides polygyrus]|uniref:Uncharacterized protein n=1 Tax=Heligmosomoides polygyrus TaxID=6339 RepID=A0A183FFE9_HELPZ|nr:unnamed protein product [Heligmosomoides polygyrus]